MNQLSINAICKKCGGEINKDGIFESALDPYNIQNHDLDKDIFYYYHTLLDFLGIDKYSKENPDKISERIFFHKECIPEEYKKFIPTKEAIDGYLETNDVGKAITIGISKKAAQKSRIAPKIKNKNK